MRGMALFTDTSFPCSITLSTPQWLAIVTVLRDRKLNELADKVAAQIGRRPE